MKQLVLIVAISTLLMGCEQQYRYPCQDPENWDNEECKKPLCEVNRDCPEHIFKEGNGGQPVPSAPKSFRGECK